MLTALLYSIDLQAVSVTEKEKGNFPLRKEKKKRKSFPPITPI